VGGDGEVENDEAENDEVEDDEDGNGEDRDDEVGKGALCCNGVCAWIYNTIA